MISCENQRILDRLSAARAIWFFLDYDGTLADFAATPDEIIPDPDLIDLLQRLSDQADVRVTILSGRRLAHIQALLPVGGIFKAGTYGLELQTTQGERIDRLDIATVRPLLIDLEERWRSLLDGRNGFYLEDKGWTLAIHAKDAAADEAQDVLRMASQQAAALLEQKGSGNFRLQGGHRFLECSPLAADKNGAVEYLVLTYPWSAAALLVYLGDDDKDEIAFAAIQQRGGVAVAVGDRLVDSTADCYLPTPTAARQWLKALLNARK